MKDRLLALAQEFHQAQKLAEDVKLKNQKILEPLLCYLRTSKDRKFFLLNESRSDYVGVNDACLQEFVTVVYWNEEKEEGSSDMFTVVVGDPNSTLGLWRWVEKIKGSGS